MNQLTVLNTFAIRAKHEFYVIGKLVKGEVQPNWFLNVPLNGGTMLTVRISAIDDIDMEEYGDGMKLLCFRPFEGEEGDFTIDLLRAMGLEEETFNITVDGED